MLGFLSGGVKIYSSLAHLLEKRVVPRVRRERQDHAVLGHVAQLTDHVRHLA